MVFVLQLDDDKFQEKLCRQTASPESQTAADATAAVTWREGFSLTWRHSSASKQRPTSLRCYLQAPAHHFYYSCMQPPEAFVDCHCTQPGGCNDQSGRHIMTIW
ncbi:unnamed protein product [Musa textilis]